VRVELLRLALGQDRVDISLGEHDRVVGVVADQVSGLLDVVVLRSEEGAFIHSRARLRVVRGAANSIPDDWSYVGSASSKGHWLAAHIFLEAR
jgi:hypothetical protein